MKRPWWITSLVIVLAWPVLAPVAIAAQPPAIENFEGPLVPPGWSAGTDGNLQITQDRFKSGGRSLCWNWQKPGAVLVGSVPGGEISTTAKQCLAFWLYNEKPLTKVLHLELLSQGKVIGHGWYILNFKGWRPLAVPYAQMGTPPFRLDGFRLKVPPDLASGRLFLDLVNFQCLDVPLPDNQQPWIGKPAILQSSTPEKFIYSDQDIAQNRPWLPKRKPSINITEEERQSMEVVARRCLTGDKLNGMPGLLPAFLTPQADPKILEDFQQNLKIQRSPQGVLRGTPIVPVPIWGSWKFNFPSDGVVIGDILDRLVRAYLFEKARGQKDRAQQLLMAFFDACDHLLDQGYAKGNNNISCSGFPIRCVLTMRQELAATGRLREMLLSSANCCLQIRGDILMHEDWSRVGYYPRNTDLSPDYLTLLVLTVLLPDDEERLQRLYAYSRTLHCLCDPGLGEPYAWDGTGHHHGMFHTAYTGGVFIRQAFPLRGTVFKVSPETMAILKRALLAYAFMAGPGNTLPPNIPGYTGQPLGASVPFVAPLLAQCDTAENKEGLDPFLAGIYLALPGYNDPKNPFTQQCLAQGSKPHYFQGHLTLNGAAIALHRRDDWLVSIAGQFKFRRGYEANGAYIASAFNHYSRNGSVCVVSTGKPPSPWDSGFSLEGWDSHHHPGTTGYLGESELQLYARMNNSQSAFAGGTSLDGNGIWGMEFIHESSNAPDNIRFHRSAFCFGDRVTSITTNLGRGPAAGPAEKDLEMATTLYQNSFGSGGETEVTGKGVGHFGLNPPKKPAPVPPEQEPCWADGISTNAFPSEFTLPAGKPHWLVDNKRTGYYVHPESPPLKITRRPQQWNYLYRCWARTEQKVPKPGSKLDPKNFHPTVGNFATAWFVHGTRPDLTECVYTLVPATTPTRMATFAREMNSPETAPYTILQKDDRAHILRDRPSQTTGYVIFQKGPVRVAGPLQEVNRPCCVMISTDKDRLRLSVASTDLDDWPTAYLGKIQLSGNIILTLQGEWQVQSLQATTPRDYQVERRQGTTILSIPFKDFMPTILMLERWKS